MAFAVCSVPVAPLRREPFHKSEMTSQLLFGEGCLVVEEMGSGWSRVICRYDGYEGWCQAAQLIHISGKEYAEGGSLLTGDWVNSVVFDGRPMIVPHGSWLTGMHNSQTSWGGHSVVYTGHIWDPAANFPDSLKIVETAFQYINTPYLWGGKSVFGADCSGFTQKVFQFFNIPLLRDAWQQATQGSTINGLSESRRGDLAFFDNDEGRITHVGILLDDSGIIHASGRVKVDKIDDQGIRDPYSTGHTHRLKLLKRYF